MVGLDILNDDKRLAELVSHVESICGHVFSNKKLVIQAMTHPSAVEGDPNLSYERLEFLGDSIVGFTVASEAYRRFSGIDEGVLTKMRIAVVNGNFLSNASTEKGLSDWIIYGSSELTATSRGSRSAAEDIFESITAAIFLDAGLPAAQAWVLDNLGDYISPANAEIISSPKSILQEVVQAKAGTVSYKIISTDGPSHAPSFCAEAYIDGKPCGQGVGATKKAAESAAAADALERRN